MKVFALVLTALLAPAISMIAPGADRVALVIGNSAYQHGNPLKNPKADAEDLAAVLRRCGFALIGGGAHTDLGHEAMEAQVSEFRRAAADAKVALFFFAGHGLEVGGSNYLIPTDAEVEEEFQVKHRTLALDEVLGAMAGGDKLKIVILDCCRNNPLGRGWGRGAGAGLGAPKGTPNGTVLLFAAAPGRVAVDGRGRNSPFTTELKKALLEPGVEIEKVFKQVGAGVFRSTGKQRPWMNSSFYGEFVFVPGGAGRSAPALPATPRTASKGDPFVNGLGMKFVPVPITGGPTDGKRVLFSVWETRVKDYAAYATANPGVDMAWKDCSYKGHKQGGGHPVVNVRWEDAVAFCAWLTRRERAAGRIGAGHRYRLPSDHEWSCAAGIGVRESALASPKAKDKKIVGYPWGMAWPPPAGAGNFFATKIEGYTDSHAFTAPVGSYRTNGYGMYDVSGNAWEWCEDWYDPSAPTRRVLRGGSWRSNAESILRFSLRRLGAPSHRHDYFGFRCVLEVGAGS